MREESDSIEYKRRIIKRKKEYKKEIEISILTFNKEDDKGKITKINFHKGM